MERDVKLLPVFLFIHFCLFLYSFCLSIFSGYVHQTPSIFTYNKDPREIKWWIWGDFGGTFFTIYLSIFQVMSIDIHLWPIVKTLVRITKNLRMPGVLGKNAMLVTCIFLKELTTAVCAIVAFQSRIIIATF